MDEGHTNHGHIEELDAFFRVWYSSGDLTECPFFRNAEHALFLWSLGQLVLCVGLRARVGSLLLYYEGFSTRARDHSPRMLSFSCPFYCFIFLSLSLPSFCPCSSRVFLFGDSGKRNSCSSRLELMYGIKRPRSIDADVNPKVQRVSRYEDLTGWQTTFPC